MADGVEIKVDTRSATAKFDRVPPAVRDRLRQALPPLLSRLAAAINNKLGTQLKTRASLTVAQQLHESSKEIYGTVTLVSPAAQGLLPTYLEMGTRPHEIVGNPVLAFKWDFMAAYGGSASANTTMAFFRRVRHPGTRPYKFMSATFGEQQDSIVAALRESIRAASREVR